jgi:vacuolar-type H+-ATPase subunit E/Vma4
MHTNRAEQKLAYFADIMQHMVETKKHEARLETTAGLSKMASQALAQAANHHKISLKAKQDEARRKANKHIAKAKVHAMAAYVQMRHDHIDRLFIEVEAALTQFTQGNLYEAYLIDHIKQAQSISDFAIVQLSPQDMHLGSAVKTATGLAPEAGRSDYIGGFMLLNKARSIQVDCTFKTRLAVAKGQFNYDEKS